MVRDNMGRFCAALDLAMGQDRLEASSSFKMVRLSIWGTRCMFSIVSCTGTMDIKEAEGLEAKWKLETFRQQKWDEQPSRTFDELMLPYLKETMHRRRQGEHRVRTIAKPLF